MMSFPVIPDHCRRCGDVLEGTDAEPIRHQVWDLPPIKPIVTEYQQHRLRLKRSQQRQLFVDESPTKQKNTKAWLWVAVAPMFAVFGIFPNRKRTSLKALIGNRAIVNCCVLKNFLSGVFLHDSVLKGPCPSMTSGILAWLRSRFHFFEAD